MSKKKKFFIIIVVVLAYLYYTAPKERGKTVRSKAGLVVGVISQSRDGRDFYEWLGIPYGMPPEGQLRFANPEPVEAWEGIWDASEYGPSCAQMSYIMTTMSGSENCLYLNVHAPMTKRQKGKPLPLLPVIIYIHGGAFMQGGSDRHRPDFFMDEEVVLVTFNYRVGLLGFVSTGDEMIRGNMGLKDQALAIKWVNNNIKAFGGDPARVTLLGESAGAASVHYHILSWQTKGMFQKAAISSGAVGNAWSFIPPSKARAKAKAIAEALNCPAKYTLDIAECLKAAPLDKLLGSVRTDLRDLFVFMPHLQGEVIGPTMEKVNDEEAFLLQHPLDILDKGKFQKVPLLVGVMADEGRVSSSPFYVSQWNMRTFEGAWEENIIRLCLNGSKGSEEMAKKIKEYYFFSRSHHNKKELSDEEKLPKYTEFLSDCLINYSVLRAVEFHRQAADVFLYYFNAGGGPSMTGLTMSLGRSFSYLVDVAFYFLKAFVRDYILRWRHPFYGVAHGDDLPMMFPMPLLPNVDQSHSHYGFSKAWVKLLVEFASTNKKSLKFGDVTWNPVPKTGPLKYMEVSRSPKMGNSPFHKRLEFLRSIGLR